MDFGVLAALGMTGRREPDLLLYLPLSARWGRDHRRHVWKGAYREEGTTLCLVADRTALKLLDATLNVGELGVVLVHEVVAPLEVYVGKLD